MSYNIMTPDKSEAKQCAELIHMAGSHIFRYLFNMEEAESIKLLERLFHYKNSTYSKESIKVIKKDDDICGLIISLSSTAFIDCEKASLGHLTKEKGLFFTLGYIFRGMSMLSMPRFKKDEYYIGYLAVYPDYRGQGLGIKLLDEAERSAKDAGYTKLSLNVEDYNEKAKKIYEKYGFHEAGYSMLPKKCNKAGLIGISKMIKILQ